MRACDGPVGQDALCRFDPKHEPRQHFDVLGGDDRRRLLALWWRRDSGAKTEERALNLVRPLDDLFVFTDTTCKTQHGVKFVHGTVGFDPEVGFRYTNATGETGLASVAALG